MMLVSVWGDFGVFLKLFGGDFGVFLKLFGGIWFF